MGKLACAVQGNSEVVLLVLSRHIGGPVMHRLVQKDAMHRVYTNQDKCSI